MGPAPAPAQRLVTRDFAERIFHELKRMVLADVLRVDLRLILGLNSFSTCSRVLAVLCMSEMGYQEHLVISLGRIKRSQRFGART